MTKSKNKHVQYLRVTLENGGVHEFVGDAFSDGKSELKIKSLDLSQPIPLKEVRENVMKQAMPGFNKNDGNPS